MTLPVWAILALSASVFWASISILDKILISNYMNYRQLFMASPIRLLFLIPFLLFFDLSIDPIIALIAFIVGGASAFSIIFYYLALKDGEVSRLAPLFCFTPLFVALFSAIFLSEIFTVTSYAGILLLILGAFLISYRHEKKEKFNKRAIGLLFLSLFLFSLFNILLKYALGFVDLLSMYFFYSVGAVVFAPVYFWIREDKKEFFSKFKQPRILFLLFLSSALVFTSYILHFLAVSSGFVTFVSALEEIQAFFVIIIAAVVSLLNKNLIKEKFSFLTFIQKLVAVSLLVGGVIIIL